MRFFKLTRILDVVPRPVQHLQWPREVERVEAGVEAEEDLDDGSGRVGPVGDCTHLALWDVNVLGERN